MNIDDAILWAFEELHHLNKEVQKLPPWSWGDFLEKGFQIMALSNFLEAMGEA